MSHPPIPPAASAGRRPTDAERPGDTGYAYRGLSAQETIATYFKRLHSIKAQSTVLLLANLLALIAFIDSGHWALYCVCLVCIPAIAIINRIRIGKLFQGLTAIVSQDCDVARYRAVMDALSARDRFGRSANTIAIELAYCDYLEFDSRAALARLETVSFKRPENFGWYRKLQVEFLSRLDLDDIDGARMTLDRLTAFRQNFKEGTPNRAAVDAQIADFAVMLRPPSERDAGDAARMRERVALAMGHQQRANWQVYLAEYELLHGSLDEAERLASDPALDPLTPRTARLRNEVQAGLEARR